MLKRSHEPLVEVKQSSIGNAGLGVFLRSGVSKPNRIEKNQVLCLYPGVYTPPIPNHVKFDEHLIYLANQWYDHEENGYILNLNDNPNIGGYIDGLENTEYITSTPSACAHLVNHNGFHNANVYVVSFCWSYILSNHFLKDESMSKSLVLNEYFSIPNTIRSDGMPWYFDGSTEEIVYFPSAENSDIPCDISLPLRGAALCSQRVIINDKDEELFLNYDLSDPLPKWANGWYQP